MHKNLNNNFLMKHLIGVIKTEMDVQNVRQAE